MLIYRLFANALVLSLELGAIAVAAWAALTHPFGFAVATAALSLVMGLRLEYARLANEYAFYFGRALGARSLVAAAYATGEAVIKALLAGLAALLTFSGTDQDRLWLVALLFGATVFAGTSLLRWLAVNLGASPARWGYFRLAAMLGVLFSAGLAIMSALDLIATPSLTDIVKTTLWDTAARPPVTEASELLFKLKQYVDAAIVSFLSIWFGPQVAQILGVVLSVNMLTGFVAAIYAVFVAASVRVVDDALP